MARTICLCSPHLQLGQLHAGGWNPLKVCSPACAVVDAHRWWELSLGPRHLHWNTQARIVARASSQHGGWAARVTSSETQPAAAVLLFLNQPWNSHGISFNILCLLGASHSTVFCCFYGMNISKLRDTFKNRLDLPTGHYFISSSYLEITLIPPQYPHKSQLLWRQAQAQVQDCTILDWCK